MIIAAIEFKLMRFLGPFLGLIINPAFRHSYGIAEEADCNGKSQQGRLLLFFSLPALNRTDVRLLAVEFTFALSHATLLLCISDTRL